MVADELLAGKLRVPAGPAGAVTPAPVITAPPVVSAPEKATGTVKSPFVPPLRVTVTWTGAPPTLAAIGDDAKKANVTLAFGSTMEIGLLVGVPGVPGLCGAMLTVQEPVVAGVTSTIGIDVNEPAANVTGDVVDAVQPPRMVKATAMSPAEPLDRLMRTSLVVVKPVAREVGAVSEKMPALLPVEQLTTMFPLGCTVTPE